MFDKLLEAVKSFGERLLPFVILDPYSAAAVARLGKYHRSIGPGGFHWLMPFWLEYPHTDTVVRRTLQLGNQSLRMADGAVVTVFGIVVWEIVDIRKAALEVEHLDRTVKDTFHANVADVIRESTYDQLFDLDKKIKRRCAAEAKRYGVKVIRFAFSDAVQCPTFRLIQD